MSLTDFGFQFQGKVYRGHDPQWSFAPESGEGAARRGGRWNKAGQPVLYTCERFETAWLECQQGFPFKTQPITLCTYEVDCGPILDLCDAEVRMKVASNPDAWLDEDWLTKKRKGLSVMAWEIAQMLMAEGFAGIRVPSQVHGATERDVNVVFWKWGRAKPTRVEVIDDHGRLPKRPTN